MDFIQHLNINFHIILSEAENNALKTLPAYDIHDNSDRKRPQNGYCFKFSTLIFSYCTHLLFICNCISSLLSFTLLKRNSLALPLQESSNLIVCLISLAGLPLNFLHFLSLAFSPIFLAGLYAGISWYFVPPSLLSI